MVEFVLGLFGIVDCGFVAVVPEVTGGYEAVSSFGFMDISWLCSCSSDICGKGWETHHYSPVRKPLVFFDRDLVDEHDILFMLRHIWRHEICNWGMDRLERRRDRLIP